MGKIDVKIELNDDGQLRAVISAEKPETLDLLQRDARGLEKALQDAGLKTDMNSLAFRKGGGNAHDPEQGPEDRRRQATGTEEPQPVAQEAADRRSLHDGSLDISV